MAPIVKDKSEEDANIPKLLCQMDNHLGRKTNFCYEMVNLTILEGFYDFSMCKLCKMV